jgi:lipid-binding SYLF domain-containing protein
MKKALVSILLAGLAGSALAGDKKEELDDRIRSLTAKLETLQEKADKRVPADSLRKAQGIILLDRTKAGFMFAFQGGGGVAIVRNPQTQQWGPAAFLSAREASIGFQVGGEKDFCVILLMTTNATRLLTEPNYDVGGEAQGTAGNQSAGVGSGGPYGGPAMLVYDDRQGLFGGAAFKGGDISPDDEHNRIYYGQYVSMADVIFHKKVNPTEPAVELAAKLDDYSKVAAK